MRYSLHVEFNSEEIGSIESYTVHNLTKKEVLDIMKQEQKEVEKEPEIDYVLFETFKLKKGFNENDNFHLELWDGNNNMVTKIKNFS